MTHKNLPDAAARARANETQKQMDSQSVEMHGHTLDLGRLSAAVGALEERMEAQENRRSGGSGWVNIGMLVLSALVAFIVVQVMQ